MCHPVDPPVSGRWSPQAARGRPRPGRRQVGAPAHSLRRLPGPIVPANHVGAAARNSSRCSAPAPPGAPPAGVRRSPGAGRRGCTARPGRARPARSPTTRPDGSSPRARSARTVSSVWFRVPRPARRPRRPRPDPSGARQRGGQVEEGAAVGVEPHQQAAGALDEHGLVLVGEREDPVGVLVDPAGSGTPCRRAAVSGASGSSSGVHSCDRQPVSALHHAQVAAGVLGDPGLHGLDHRPRRRRRTRPAPPSRWSCRPRCRCR